MTMEQKFEFYYAIAYKEMIDHIFFLNIFKGFIEIFYSVTLKKLKKCPHLP